MPMHTRLTKRLLTGMIMIVGLSLSTRNGSAQNPFINDQFTADPSARVFNNKVYVFPSHDILASEGKGRIGWFCMEDYHVFSSSNLTDWTDHGVIIKQNEVPWVKKNSYSMWAPDCIFRNGKYYFYFPTTPADTSNIGKGFTIGVAIAEKPEGPYIPQPEPIKHVRGIDPNVFIDTNGDAHLYWSAGNIFGAKLKPSLLELESEVKILGELPSTGLKEGPYMFKRNGLYYLTYPHVENKIERLEYAVGNTPLGPFKVTGVIMDESPTGCWTNHQSIIEFNKQWYLFYHHNDYSPKFDKSRSVRIDSLFFNEDGTIRKVHPTLRGVGVTPAGSTIQIDRYTAISDQASIDFLDSANTFKGWKTIFREAGSWVRYNRVDFGKKTFRTLSVMAQSPAGGTIQIRTADAHNVLLGELNISSGGEWSKKQIALKKIPPGVHDIIVTLKNGASVQIDWINFQ